MMEDESADLATDWEARRGARTRPYVLEVPTQPGAFDGARPGGRCGTVEEEWTLERRGLHEPTRDGERPRRRAGRPAAHGACTPLEADGPLEMD